MEASATLVEIRTTIESVFARHAEKAAQAEYDKSVFISAVAAARDVCRNLPVTGTADTYLQSVLDALDELFSNYNDTDGEYTNGRAAIGDVRRDIANLKND